MNSAKAVNAMVEGWKAEGRTKAEIIVKTAEAELGWPYVWGATGQECTPAKREAFVKREDEKEAGATIRKCQVLNGSKSDCTGCKCFPGGERVLIDDCQGFVKQLHRRIGITLIGGGATSMWKNTSNWEASGEIADIPKDKVCCVFQWNSSKRNMQHVGEHIGGGAIIHCSGEVKRGKITDKGWTHWAIPKGLEGGVVPVPDPGKERPTIRKGSRGESVREMQEDLIHLGYDCGKAGADGICGTGTVAAIRAFQADHPPLVADGICGKLTWAAIDEAMKGGEIEYYTVTIPHLTKHHAEALVKNYAGATMAKEGGEGNA